jgi:hypothetical protein
LIDKEINCFLSMTWTRSARLCRFAQSFEQSGSRGLQQKQLSSLRSLSSSYQERRSQRIYSGFLEPALKRQMTRTRSTSIRILLLNSILRLQ